MRPSAATFGLIWLVALACSASAWFVSDEVETTAAASTVPTSPPGQTGKVLEASRQHISLMLQDLKKSLTAAAPNAQLLPGSSASDRTPAETSPTEAAPTAVHVTKDYWDTLPDWLPARVQQEFHRDNADFSLRRSASGGKPTPPPAEAVPTAAPMTKDFWEELPDWLPTSVGREFQKDNADFVRALVGNQVETTSAPAAASVTKHYWDDLPDWLPARVKHEFARDNAEFVERRRPTTAAEVQPTAARETRNFWDQLPDWLPERVRQEFLKDNAEFSKRTVGSKWTPQSAPQSAPQSTPPNTPPSTPPNTPPSTPPMTPQTTVEKATAVLTSASEEALPPWLIEYLKTMSTTTAETSTVAKAERVTSLARLQIEKSEGQKSRYLGSRSDQARPAASVATKMTPTLPPPQTPEHLVPTRSPLTLSSVEALPPKCSRQVNWLDQDKCASLRSKWTFNPVTLQCEWLAYYGCQLNNGNVFNSRRDCESYCIRGIVNPCNGAKCIPAYSFYQSACFLLNDTACVSRILQQYSHIGSPAVRMEMAREQILLFCQPPVARCLNTAVDVRGPTFESPPTYDEPSDVPSHCLLPPDRGSCQPDQRGRRSGVFYYSQQHNQCRFMMHFGCGGNLNKFANQADCYNNCGI